MISVPGQHIITTLHCARVATPNLQAGVDVLAMAPARWLSALRSEAFLESFERLGVERVVDFTEVLLDDLLDMQLPLLHRRRFAVAAAEADGLWAQQRALQPQKYGLGLEPSSAIEWLRELRLVRLLLPSCPLPHSPFRPFSPHSLARSPRTHHNPDASQPRLLTSPLRFGRHRCRTASWTRTAAWALSRSRISRRCCTATCCRWGCRRCRCGDSLRGWRRSQRVGDDADYVVASKAGRQRAALAQQVGSAVRVGVMPCTTWAPSYYPTRRAMERHLPT